MTGYWGKLMQLVTPSAKWRAAFLDMARECAAAGDERYALAISDFDAYLRRLEARRRSEYLPAGEVPQAEFWLVDDGEVIACARLRLTLTPALEVEGGHVGYDVRPSMRRRGYATELLRLTVVEARAYGIERVLVTCDDDNVGSIRVIEHNGGMLAGRDAASEGGKAIRQYWIG